MSTTSLGYSREPLPPSKRAKKGRKRKSGVIGNKSVKAFPSPAKRLKLLRKNQLVEQDNLKMERIGDEKVEGHEKANRVKGNSTDLTNQSTNESTTLQSDRELVCRICQRPFHELNDLALHEKIPHFWSCTHRGCELAFETKADRVQHVEEFHSAEQFTGGNTELDHLVMNSDGTMSFNYLTSATTKRRSRHYYHQEVDLSLLAKNSDYGGNRVKNGYSNRASYRTRTKNEKWNKDDTTKFYKNLSIYGCNFALLAALFKGRSRKQLKNKYKKEERENPKLIKNALTNRQPMELNIDEFEEIVNENMKAKQTLAQKADGGGDIIKKKKANNKATARERKASRTHKAATKVPHRDKSTMSVREQRLHVPARQLKSELSGTTPLELGPPPGAEEGKMLDDESSDYEFDPFA